MKTKRALAVVKKEPYTVEVACSCKTGFIKTPEGIKLPCAYCKGTKRRQEKRVHPSHKMTKFESTILAPSGTPRFYSVRHCKVCGQTEAVGTAGHFMAGLGKACPEKLVADPDSPDFW
jgi:hypothetical protein